MGFRFGGTLSELSERFKEKEGKKMSKQVLPTSDGSLIVDNRGSVWQKRGDDWQHVTGRDGGLTYSHEILQRLTTQNQFSFTVLHNASVSSDMGELIDRVKVWSRDRKITHPVHGSSVEKQYLKLGEEFGELGAALARGNLVDAKDAIGDNVVVLVNIGEILGVPIEECLESVLEVIEKRKGEMRDGVFIKEEDL